MNGCHTNATAGIVLVLFVRRFPLDFDEFVKEIGYLMHSMYPAGKERMGCLQFSCPASVELQSLIKRNAGVAQFCKEAFPFGHAMLPISIDSKILLESIFQLNPSARPVLVLPTVQGLALLHALYPFQMDTRHRF